jgi:hypothetical protein
MELQTIDQPVPPRSIRAPKRERIPKPVIRACELLGSGECKTIVAAAARVGITREWLGKMLGRSHVQAYLARESQRTVSTAVWRASNRLVELLDAKSEPVCAQVAQRILTDQGILKSDQGHGVAVNVNVAGYVINLADPDTPMKTINPTISTTSGSE